MHPLLERFLKGRSWNPKWQQELGDTLEEAQQGLPVNLVVVITKESDFYGELLFLLSFLGMLLGTLLCYLMKDWIQDPREFVIFPVFGFSAGATIFSLRDYYIRKVAPRAIKNKVTARAKSFFYDYQQKMPQQLALIFISEVEKQAMVLSSPDVSDRIPQGALKKILDEFTQQYSERNPLKTLRPCLLKIGDLIRKQYGDTTTLTPQSKGLAPIVVGASDQSTRTPRVIVLKGYKDIN